MEALQREILDMRRDLFRKVPQHSRVNSFGGLGLRAGLAMSGVGWSAPDVVVRPESLSIWDAIGSELPVECLMGETVAIPTEARPRVAGLREREVEWRRTHAEILKSYENEWVVVEGDKLIAHGSDPAQVIREAKSKGIKTPYIFLVEPKIENLVRIGL